MITAKIKFGILLWCFPTRFLMFSLVFLVLQTVFNVFSVIFAKTQLLFCCFCIRLFVSNSDVCIVPYGVKRNFDAIIHVSSYVRLNPGLQRARPLRSGATNKLIMYIVAAERSLRYSQWQRLWGNCLGTFRTTCLSKLGFWYQGISFLSRWWFVKVK